MARKSSVLACADKSEWLAPAIDLTRNWRTHERRRRGRRIAVALWRRLPRRKTVPKGKVVVHGFPDGGTNVWVQLPTDDIEPCDCGSRLFGPTHYREKEGIKREIAAVLSAPRSAG